MRLRRRLSITSLLVVVMASTWPSTAEPAAAQRQPPDNSRAFALYGRRHVVPLPSSSSTPRTGVLRASNVGWNETTVGWVAIGAPATLECPAAFAPTQVRDAGCGSPLGAHARMESVAAIEGATHLLVYSLAGPGAVQACEGLDSVAGGALDLAEWERTVMVPGEPVVVSVALRTSDGAETVVTGEPVVADLVGNERAFPRTLSVPAADDGAVVSVVVLGTECGVLQGSWGPLHEADCLPSEPVRVTVPPMSAAQVPATFSKGAFTFTTNRPTAGVVSHHDENGWYSLPLTVTGDGSREARFPIVAGLADDLTSQLWVTNQHMTATTTIDIFILAGAGQLHRLVTDPVPLCPRGARVYDIAALAGPLPAPGRGPAILSLRVTSTNLDLPAAPPIAASVVMSRQSEKAAYSGFAVNGFNVLGALTGGRDAAVPGTPVMAVEGVQRNAGQPASTSVIAIQSSRSGNNNTQVYVDFYDDDGSLIVHDAYFAVQGDGAILVHLGRPMAPVGGGDPMQLPDGFRGTAIVRSQNPRGSLAVIAFELPSPSVRPDTVTAPTGKSGEGLSVAGSAPDQNRSAFSVREGVLLIHPVDPSVPTLTPPVREPTPTATSVTSPQPPGNRLFMPQAFTN